MSRLKAEVDGKEFSLTIPEALNYIVMSPNDVE